MVTDWRIGRQTAQPLIAAARAKLPVLVVSSVTAQAFKTPPPADVYLEKPTSPTELLGVIDTLLASKAPQERTARMAARAK